MVNFKDPIVFIPLGLFLFGIIEVFTASRFKGIEMTGNEYYFALMHTVWVLISVFLSFIVSFLRPAFWRKISKLLFILTLITLIVVFFFPATNGSHRWIKLGAFFYYQVAEFAKFFTIIYFANMFSNENEKYVDKSYKAHFNQYFLPTFIKIGFIVGLVIIEPDLGTSVIIALVLTLMYFSLKNKYLKKNALTLLLAGVAFLTISLIIWPYRLGRVNTFVEFIRTGKIKDEFGDGFQLRNILIGVGSGGLWGKGIGQSRQRYGYLVEVTAFTDSIVAVIFEELGFLLSSLFVLTYFLIYNLLSKKARENKDLFSALVIQGVANWIIFQAFVHFFTNIGLVPITGIPLPFITYGGSSSLSMGLAIGTVWGLINSEKTVQRNSTREIIAR